VSDLIEDRSNFLCWIKGWKSLRRPRTRKVKKLEGQKNLQFMERGELSTACAIS
jgi:hypothetical protein